MGMRIRKRLRVGRRRMCDGASHLHCDVHFLVDAHAINFVYFILLDV